MHIFPYSMRPGTKAAAMPGQLTREEKAGRCRRAGAVAAAARKAYLDACVGRTLEVIFETEADGASTGHAENYAEVKVPGEGLRGLVKKVKITAVEGQMLVGSIL